MATPKQTAAPSAAAAGAIVAIAASSSTCPCCHRTGDVTISAKHPVCRLCADAIARQARASQEVDYLCRWLSSRVNVAGDPLDDSGLVVYPHEKRAVRRVVAQARTAGLEWQHPPEPMPYDRRLATLLAPWRQPHAAT